MHRWRIVLRTLALVALVAASFIIEPVTAAQASAGGSLDFGPELRKKPIQPPALQPIALGAWIPDAPWNITKLDEYATLVGAMPAIVLSYQDWVHDATFQTAYMNEVHARGATPLVTWEPWDYTAGPTQPTFALKTIAAGGHDAHIRQYARAAAAWNRPFYLRFAHEMNAQVYPWSASAHGNSPGDYVVAWRHVHDIFRQEGATNVRWVWSPNVAYAGTTPFAEVYPGDTYVDWIGLDGYNGGAALDWGGWLSLKQVFAASYHDLTRMTNKPLMIGETASVEIGGDKAGWISQAFLTDLPNLFPQVRAVVWFQENKEADWRVDSSPASLAAWRQVVNSPVYKGALP